MHNVKIKRVESDADLLPMLGEFERLIDEITRRAYQRFEERGREHGRDLDDWLLTESDVLGAPAAEMTESKGEFQVAVALNGFKPTGISVIAGSRDTIVTVKNGISDGLPSMKVMRHIRYPQLVEVETVRASFDNGILSITAAKAGAAPGGPAMDELRPGEPHRWKAS